MKKIFIFLLLPVLLLAGVLAGLFLSLPWLVKEGMRRYCLGQGVVFQVAAVRGRLPGRLVLSSAEFQKNGQFSFHAGQLELITGLRDILPGNWQLRQLNIRNGRLEIPENTTTGPVQLSEIKLEARQIAAGGSGSMNLHCQIASLDLKERGCLRGGELALKSDFSLSPRWRCSRLQGSVQAAGVELRQGNSSAGSLSADAVFAVRQEAEGVWQVIPSAGEEIPLNAVRVRQAGREILNLVCKSGEWNQVSAPRTMQLQADASCIDSEPLLALLFPAAAAWGSGKLNFLALDLRSRGPDAAGLLRNLEGTAVFDIASLQLKNTPFIDIFSRRTGLELPSYLQFERGSAIARFSNQVVRLTTTTPFQGQHPVVEADGTVAFDGRLQLRLHLGFSPELEQRLAGKKYFQPFARICPARNGFRMLPGPLTLTGTLDSPGVDLTGLLKASAKAGLKYLFEDNGRIGIRWLRPNRESPEKNGEDQQ